MLNIPLLTVESVYTITVIYTIVKNLEILFSFFILVLKMVLMDW